MCIFLVSARFTKMKIERLLQNDFQPIVRTCSKIFLNDTGHYLLIYLVGRIVWDVQTKLQSSYQDYVWNPNFFKIRKRKYFPKANLTYDVFFATLVFTYHNLKFQIGITTILKQAVWSGTFFKDNIWVWMKLQICLK